MMKRLLMICVLAVTTIGFAQEKKKVTTKTSTTVRDSGGEETVTKSTVKTETQDIRLTNFDGKHNFNTVMTPTKINTDVDYEIKGSTYRFMPLDNGYYTINNMTTKKPYARLYPTSQAGYYIYTQDNNSSFGYFNEDGDFVVESYDPDGDGVANYIYKIKMSDDMKKKQMMKEKEMKMKNDKM
ncbi:hypothetical protein ACFQO1_06320 [Jejudonia soesokkakensis]|uniref:Uncharacterized protein n=1 Tax=Jejudonia soesokkakensis TaxID=1323432 RepID=A0ABW2MSP7_9FLAO